MTRTTFNTAFLLKSAIPRGMACLEATGNLVCLPVQRVGRGAKAYSPPAPVISPRRLDSISTARLQLTSDIPNQREKCFLAKRGTTRRLGFSQNPSIRPGESSSRSPSWINDAFPSSSRAYSTQHFQVDESKGTSRFSSSPTEPESGPGYVSDNEYNIRLGGY